MLTNANMGYLVPFRNANVSITQCSWAVDGWKKICKPCSLKNKVFGLPKGQNEPKMKIFQPGIFE